MKRELKEFELVEKEAKPGDLYDYFMFSYKNIPLKGSKLLCDDNLIIIMFRPVLKHGSRSLACSQVCNTNIERRNESNLLFSQKRDQ